MTSNFVFVSRADASARCCCFVNDALTQISEGELCGLNWGLWGNSFVYILYIWINPNDGSNLIIQKVFKFQSTQTMTKLLLEFLHLSRVKNSYRYLSRHWYLAKNSCRDSISLVWLVTLPTEISQRLFKKFAGLFFLFVICPLNW